MFNFGGLKFWRQRIYEISNVLGYRAFTIPKIGGPMFSIKQLFRDIEVWRCKTFVYIEFSIDEIERVPFLAIIWSPTKTVDKM